METKAAPTQRFAGVEPRWSVDSLLRMAQQHHMQLSMMADNKASMLITISSIALTVALSRAGDTAMRPALLTLAAACLLSLLLAIIAVLPSFDESGPLGAGSKPRNILFFGHFALMNEDAYMAEMERIIASDPLVYETAVREIHSLGSYLYRKKYRFLRYAYVALLAGFILATGVEVWVRWL